MFKPESFFDVNECCCDEKLVTMFSCGHKALVSEHNIIVAKIFSVLSTVLHCT